MTTLPTKHLGDLTWYMGVEYKRDRENRVIELSQTSYIKSVLERFDITRSSSLPASTSTDLRSVNGGWCKRGFIYRRSCRFSF